MFTFGVQLIDSLRYGRIGYFEIFFIYVWFIWGLKFFVSKFYQPATKPYTDTVSVVLPVVDEPEDVFYNVLKQMSDQEPDEIIVIINGKKNEKLETVCWNFPAVEVIWTPVPGKRNALRIGIEKAKSNIVFLNDSDTIWTEHTLTELIKPFANPKVGGATTLQRILDPDRNLLTRFADWMEDIRANGSMSAMSVLGQVGCLPGRTIAFRREILLRAMPEFLNDPFLGFHKEVSDDRAFTNYTLMQGYETVLQKTSIVYTDSPTEIKKYWNQQVRWGEGSQYNTLKMTPWMLRHKPFLGILYWSDILTPFLLVSVYIVLAIKIITGTHTVSVINGTAFDTLWAHLAIAVFGTIFSLGIRQTGHFIRKPKDLMLLPLFIVFLTFFMTATRLVGFWQLAEDKGWRTRKGAYEDKQRSQ